jgi:hypothetical protein
VAWQLRNFGAWTKRVNDLKSCMRDESKLDDDAFGVSGFTSFKVRHFLNNACAFEGVRYLEIGVLFGSTLISASYKNKGLFYGIDNFCGFGGAENRIELNNNLEKFKKDCDVVFIRGDCWDEGVKQFVSNGLNVYFFDGEHTYEEQYKALTEYYDKLADKFVFIVDDWNWEAPRKATLKSIEDLRLNVLEHYDLYTPDFENGRADSWWNGLGVFLLEKK